MKIQRFKISNIQWDVPFEDEDEFQDCRHSGSIANCYFVTLTEDEDPNVAIPRQVAQLSGWTPSRWTATEVK